MSFSRNGTDWIQKELLAKEGIKFNSNMKINTKEYLWRQKGTPYREKRFT